MIRTDLGAISAYAIAVSHGYTGTEAEFAEQIANAAGNAQRAENAAEDAGSAATDAIAAKNEILNSIDATLSQAGKAADAAAVGVLKKDLSKYNSMNVMDTSDAVSRTHNGITFAWNSDKTQCAVSGTSTGTASSKIYDKYDELPYGMEAGKTYIVSYSTDHVGLTLYWYDSSSAYISVNRFVANGMLTVPSNAVGAYIRLDVGVNITVNETVNAPVVLNSYSNSALNDLMVKNIKAVAANQYTSCDDITESSILFVSSGGGNLYIPDFIYVGWLQTIPVTNNIILQIAYPYNSNDSMQMRVKTIADGWTPWRVIAGGTTTIEQEVSRDTYQNTYNINVSPHITTDANGWLQPVDTNTADETGKTDMTSAIMTMLNSTGYCHLAPGIYYVSGNIDMPADSMIEGCGKQTIIRLLQTTASGYIVRMHTRSTIKNICFSGSYSAGDISNGNIGGRRGVNYIGNRDGQDAGVTPRTCTLCQIDGCWFENLDSGIYGYNAGGGLQEGIEVSNCYFTRCKAGINFDYWTEYSKFVNCVTFQCYYGCINNGGNNVFMNCTFHAVIGFLIDNSSGNKQNAAHGSVIGCTFNHINNMNNPSELGQGIAVKVLNTTAGFIFANCQFWYGRIHIESSQGIQITGCEFGGLGGSNYPVIESSGSDTIFVDNCLFQSVPIFSIASPAKFSNCWTYSGVSVAN